MEFKNAQLVCICDPAHDRMRIISPVLELKDVKEEQMVRMMEANFHTALDARYAVSDGVVYSAYIHPLSSLNESMIYSAIKQVSTLRNTFGTYFQSGELTFPKK